LECDTAQINQQDGKQDGFLHGFLTLKLNSIVGY